MTTRSRMTLCRVPVLLPLCVVLLGVLAAVPARAVTYDIQAVARPARIVYAEDNRVTITVTVYDAEGRLIGEGTPVYFHTTLGAIPTVAYTNGHGRVEVLLNNTTGPGPAIVTATVGGNQQSVTVTYVGQGATNVAEVKRPSYRLKAHQVYYSADQRVFDLRDQAEFTAPAFTITGNAIQYDVKHNILTAQHEVVITAGEKSLTAEKLRLDISANRGMIITVDPEVRYQTITLPDLTAKDDEDLKNTQYEPLDTMPTRTWIICKSASVFPNQMIQFRRPEFYLNNFDRRLYALPYHVLDLRSSNSGTFFNSNISLTSDAGLNVDFPVYYAASSDHTGAIHLRHVSRGSSYYRGAGGLQVGIDEEYLVGDKGDGGLYLDDLTNPTRGATWEHRQEFGNTRMNLNASYDRYAEDTPYTTRGGMSVSHDLGKTSLYLNTNWSTFDGSQDGLAELWFYLPSLPVAKTGLTLSCNPYVGLRRTVDAPQGTTPRLTDNEYFQGVTLGLGFPTWRLLGGTISTNMSDEIARSSSGLITNYYDINISYRRQFTRFLSTSLSYAHSLSSSHGGDEEAIGTPNNRRLSLDLSGSKSNVWQFYTYSSYDLNTETMFHSGSLTYYLPWDRAKDKTPHWFFTYRASLSSGSSESTADHLFSLGRDIGAYSVVLHYSPTGNSGVTGIGSGTGKHWAVELVRQGW